MKLSGSNPRPKQIPLSVSPQPPISAMRDKRLDLHNARWGLILLWFMRLLACLWMFRGVLVWCGILNVGLATPIDLAALPLGDAAIVLFFAVFDLVAAVGLWLAAPWGGVLWLVAALAQIADLAVTPGMFRSNLVINFVNVVLILLYFGLSWLAAQERDEVAS